MIGFGQATASIVTGCVVSCGVVLVVAGASKLYRGARGVDGATVMSRALRLSGRRWRRAELTVGAAELAVGVLVCSGASPILGGAGLASFGVVFCVLLGYVRVKRIPGDCGCIRWRPATEMAPEPATWRLIVRGGMLLCAGIIDVIVPADAARAPYLAWFGAGLLAGGTVLVLLSMRMPVRTPICRRPLWRRMRATLRVLAGHEMFAAMTASAGPFGPVARYRRTGCTDEFWFSAAAGQGQAVVFQVSHGARGGRLAVHVSLQDGRAPGSTWPARAVSVQDVPG